MLLAAIYFGLTTALCVRGGIPSPKFLRRRGEQFARTNLAFVDSEFVGAFDRATVRSARFVAAAVAVLLTALWVIIQLEPEPHDLSPVLLYLPVVAVLLACWGVWRLRDAGREFPAPVGRPVIARPRRVAPADYMAPPATYGVWVASAVSVDLAAGAVVQWRLGDASGGFAITAAGCSGVLLAATVAIQVSIRAMCERRQPAVDPCYLYFYDAWRGAFIRVAYVTILWSQFQFAASVTPWLNWPGAIDDNILEFVMLYVGAQAGVLLLSSHLRFRKRLWPGLAPRQVLLPGQSLPPRREVLA